MSGGGQGGGMGGFGNFANGGYGQRFQPQGFGQFGGQFGGQSFGGGNPWMRQSQSYGNKMGFQGDQMSPNGGNFGRYGDTMGAVPGGGWNNRPQQFGQPQTGGDFQFQERPRNDMRTIPGETYASGAPSNPYSPSGASPSIGGPGQGGPSSMPGSAFGMPVNVADQAKAGNMYGPQGAMSPPGAYEAMVAQGQQEYDARMRMPAQWGRYADGSPREDPNGLNARGQAHQGWYGGGWGR